MTLVYGAQASVFHAGVRRAAGTQVPDRLPKKLFEKMSIGCQASYHETDHSDKDEPDTACGQSFIVFAEATI